MMEKDPVFGLYTDKIDFFDGKLLIIYINKSTE